MAINFDQVRYEFAHHDPNAYETLIAEIKSVIGQEKLSRKDMISRIDSIFNAMEEGKRIHTSKFNVEV